MSDQTKKAIAKAKAALGAAAASLSSETDPDKYIDELQDLSDEDQPLDEYNERQRKQYDEQAKAALALRSAAQAVRAARSALDPMDALKDALKGVVAAASEALAHAEAGRFEKAEASLENLQDLQNSLHESFGDMKFMKDMKRIHDEERSGRPGWAR